MKPVHKRHQLKEDALVTGTFRFWTFAQEHTRQILYGVGAVALIIIIALAVTKILKTREANSIKALGEANMLYQEENYEEAISAFDQVAQKYGGTKAKKEALLYKANSMYLTGKYEEAIPAFEEAYKNGDALIKPVALKSMADCYMQIGKYSEAAEKYMEVANKYEDEWIAVPSLMKAGICYKKLGDNAKAIEVYQKVVDNYEETAQINEAKSQLFMLKQMAKK